MPALINNPLERGRSYHCGGSDEEAYKCPCSTGSVLESGYRRTYISSSIMTTQTYHAPDFTAPLLARAPSAQFAPIPADGVLPEGFFSTSNLPTYVRVGDRWVLPRRPRMDCVIVKRGDDLEVIEPRRLKKGDAIAIGLAEDGSQGIYVHTEGFLGGSHS